VVFIVNGLKTQIPFEKLRNPGPRVNQTWTGLRIKSAPVVMRLSGHNLVPERIILFFEDVKEIDLSR
jgi:hypothetical protein